MSITRQILQQRAGWLAPHRLFAVLGLVLGLAYLVLTPPFQTPDEPNHFFRAYQLSTGRVRPESDQGDYGGQIPTAAVQAYHVIINVLPGEPRRLDLADIRYFLRQPLRPELTRFIGFPNTVVYPPMSYLPQAAGAGLGRLLGGSALELLYLGRLFSLLAYLLLIYAAIRLSPAGRWVLCLIGLSPMGLTLAASFSADTATICFALLLTAVLLRQIMDPRKPLSLWALGAILVLGFLLSLSKIVYFPMVFLIFLIPVRKFGSVRRAVLIGMAIVGVCLAGNLIWNAMVKDYYLPRHLGVNFPEQTLFVRHHPFGFLKIAARTLLKAYPLKYLVECYGTMGQLAVPMPRSLTGIYYVLLLLAALTDRPAVRGGLGRWRRLAIALTAALIIGLMCAALYILCSPLRNPLIEGIQGRYFIPVLPLLMILFCGAGAARLKRALRLGRAWPWIVAGFSILSATVALWRVVVFFYGL